MIPRTLADFGGDCRPSGQQLCYQHCPVCGSDGWKLYVNPDSGFWYCHAGQHSGGGKVEVGGEACARTEGASILAMLDTRPIRLEWSEVEMPPFEPLSKRALRYLSRRGLTQEQAQWYGFVEWTDKFRVLCPYFDQQGRLIYWNSRLYSENLGDGPKYIAAPGKHPLFVPEYRTDATTLVIVEGMFDALAVHQASPHLAVALGGKSLPRYLKKPLTDMIRHGMIKEVKIALDPDALGDALKLRDRIGGQVLTFPDDPAACWASDPETFKEML